MTISVNITRQKDSKDYNLRVIRRYIKTGVEEGLDILKPGETTFSQSLWDDVEIVLREEKE